MHNFVSVKSLAALVLLAGLAPLGAAQADTRINHASGFCSAAGFERHAGAPVPGHAVQFEYDGRPARAVPAGFACRVRTSPASSTCRSWIAAAQAASSTAYYNQRAYGHAVGLERLVVADAGSGEDNRKTIVFGSSTSARTKWDGFHHIYCILPPSDSVYGDSRSSPAIRREADHAGVAAHCAGRLRVVIADAAQAATSTR